jgi:ubiquinone/menaquinone biosynthesis C-methylase UbiE
VYRIAINKALIEYIKMLLLKKDSGRTPSRSAVFWDGICSKMQRRSYYIHPELGKYKQREFLRFLHQYFNHSFERALKTDCFEEAFGSDRIVDWMIEHSGKVVGMDISPAIAARARCNTASPKVNWVSADIAQIPLGDETIDLIISTSTYGYLSDIHQGLKEAHRILRPGGVLLVSVHNRQSVFSNLITRFFISKTVPFPVGRSYRYDIFRAILEQAGFQVECHRPIVHIFPFLMTLVSCLDRLGNKQLLQRVIARLDSYSQKKLSWHYQTAWLVVFKAVKI